MLRRPGMTTSSRVPVISALGLMQILAWGSSYYLLTVIAAPIAADTGWPLSWIVGSLSVGLLVAGFVSPRVGRAIDRHGGRPVLAGSAVLLAVGLAALALAQNFTMFVVAWVVLGVGMGAGLYDAAFATLGRLYGSTARPAITLVTLWGGFASTACWPLSAYLVEHLGWRGACLTYAGLHLAVSVPLILFFIPVPPPRPQKAPGTEQQARLSHRDRQAFGVLAAILVLGGTTTTIISIHLLTLLQSQGLPLSTAVALGALIGPSQVAARILEAAGGGRHHPIWTLTAAMGLIALGVVLLWLGAFGAAVALILYGTGNGIYSIARGTLPLALFGPDRYAPIMGRLAAPNLIAQALAPLAGAAVITSGGTSTMFVALTGIAAVNVALVGVLWLVIGNFVEQEDGRPARARRSLGL